MLAISIKFAGYSQFLFALDISTCLSSNGNLNTSSELLLNSGSSSKNNIPLCAKLISPGFASFPPPISATFDAVWCGFLNGLSTINLFSFVIPAILCILVTSNASSKFMPGKIVFKWSYQESNISLTM